MQVLYISCVKKCKRKAVECRVEEVKKSAIKHFANKSSDYFFRVIEKIIKRRKKRIKVQGD